MNACSINLSSLRSQYHRFSNSTPWGFRSRPFGRRSPLILRRYLPNLHIATHLLIPVKMIGIYNYGVKQKLHFGKSVIPYFPSIPVLFSFTRLILYGATCVSAFLGLLINATQIIGAALERPGAPSLQEALKNVAIDVVGLSIFSYLFYIDWQVRQGTISIHEM